MHKLIDKKIIIINQAANYLTVGIANAFSDQNYKVVLITGSVHEQGEKLNRDIEVVKINEWKDNYTSIKKVISYAEALWRMFFLIRFKYPNSDIFFISVPPMGYLLNLLVKNKFSMIIWDVYPDTLKILGLKENSLLYKTWSKLNMKSFKKAHKLFTISDCMANMLKRYTDRELIVQPIWSIFQKKLEIDKSENDFIKIHGLQNKFVVQYSGNIGATHNVEILLDLAEYMSGIDDIVFLVIGRGSRKMAIEKSLKQRNLKNFLLLPFQTDKMFQYSISSADVGVVLLDSKLSSGSVPSKSYNLMSNGLPSVYFASKDSQLAQYAVKYNHAKCFTEDEMEYASKFILDLKNNKQYYLEISNNALIASNDFKRSNADDLVKKYIN
jgi:hypothetical protein